MVRASTWTVTKRFQGWPKPTDFELVTHELPPLKNGEILVKTEFISLDPYQLFDNSTILLAFKRSDDSLPYDQRGYQVGIVKESKNPKYPVGTRVVSHQGWKDYYIAHPSEELPSGASMREIREVIRKAPDLKGLPLSLAVGAVGMPGASAYLGFMDTRPKRGDTVVVTGAAGAVGSVVGQIAKIMGCRVIGFAGSDDKVKWLEQELGFDKALNYKTEDVLSSLQRVAPEGVDIYFDNVGGEISSSVIRHMNRGGRVCVCGTISTYNDPELAKVTILQPAILFKELEIKGFIIWSWDYSKWEKAFADIVAWIKSGQLKPREHITEGFDKVPHAFIELLSGKNSGKAVAKV